MTLPNITRKVNRGIILAILLVIGLIIYLIYDNAHFSSEKLAIQSMLNEYAKAASDINILPKEEQKPGERPSNAAIQKKLEENKVIVNQYLTDFYDFNSAREHALNDLNIVFKQNAERGAYVTECTYTIKPIKTIKRNGPNHAIAEIPIHVELKTIGTPLFFALWSYNDTSDQHHRGDPVYDNSINSEINTKTYTYTMDFTFYHTQFIKENGKWKIAEIRGWYTGIDTGKLVEN